ncbi:hypothetical protein NE237_001524 [Protea cynaroides]|uniref:VWFA domain-containing protein n=1 Tax=Protea cynaroides TaxID=273540 RepID=A0A9Q0KT99_9MAGN|nr:hypothetical protein NE237_001524 [Protea cynaroides]
MEKLKITFFCLTRDGNHKLTIDENAIKSSHAPDGKKVDVGPLHKLINEIFMPSASDSDQAVFDSHLESFLHYSYFQELSQIVHKICYQLSCKCLGGRDVNSTTVALFKMLSQYSWEMKMVLALAAFALIYGESLSTADQTNPLAKFIKPLKQLPGKSKLSKIRSLIHSIVKITNKIFDINDSRLVNISTYVQTAVSWTVGSIVVCTSQIIGLDEEYTEDELSKLKEMIDGMNTHLGLLLDERNVMTYTNYKLTIDENAIQSTHAQSGKVVNIRPLHKLINEIFVPSATTTDQAVVDSHLESFQNNAYSQELSKIVHKIYYQISTILRESGLELSNLIIGVDFSESNKRNGRQTFKGRSLHDLSGSPNPYQQAIDIIGNTLTPFTKDNKIHCYGFGDASTGNNLVFSFHSDLTPCQGFEEVLTCYKRIAQKVHMSGPTCFAPIIEAAIDIVEKSGGQHHVLVIIADDWIRYGVERDSIVTASEYALSIVYVGVGDGPWDEMNGLADKIRGRKFDNFQFVHFYDIMKRYENPSEKETALSLVSTMKIPMQYKASKEHGFLGRTTGRPTKVVPIPPP